MRPSADAILVFAPSCARVAAGEGVDRIMLADRANLDEPANSTGSAPDARASATSGSDIGTETNGLGGAQAGSEVLAPSPASADGETAIPAEGATAPSPSVASPVAAQPEPTRPSIGNAILEQLQALEQDFALKMKFDESRDRTIDDLRTELQGYRRGLHLTLLRPIVTDLMTLQDELSSLARFHAQSGELGSAVLSRTLAGFATTIEETLARNGFVAYATVDETFDGRRQRADKTEPTDDPTLDGRVFARTGKGYDYESRVFRPERVVIYRQRAGATQPVASAAEVLDLFAEPPEES